MIISVIAFYIFHIPAKTDIAYCKEIAYSVNILNLKCYRCATIEENNCEIRIWFTLKNSDLFYENEDLGIYDMAKVKKYLESYMADNPQSPLHGDKISVCFQTYPGDAMFMYNYDYRDTKSDDIHDNFLFFKNIENKYFSILRQDTENTT